MPANKEHLSLTSVPVETLLRLLRQAGAQHATQASLEIDRAAGAPISSDGIVNFVAYVAWLAKENAHAA